MAIPRSIISSRNRNYRQRYSCFTPGKPFIKHFTLIALLALLCTGVRAQDCKDDALYVTPTGGGTGSKSSPTNLMTALAMCQWDTTRHFIKLSTGTYTIDRTLWLRSNITIDGNFDTTTWIKSPVRNCVLSISPPGEEVKTLTSDHQKVTVGHYIGIRLDSVTNITLKDFTLEVHKKNSYFSDMTYDGDGKSVYGIFARKSEKIYMINLHIVTDSGGEGHYGYKGLDGASADYNTPGKTVFIPGYHTSYRPRPSEALKASYAFRAGGAGGAGGRLQRYYRCLDCPGVVTSQTTSCAAETPLPRGGQGGKNGGMGGVAGQNCEMDCYYEYYKSHAEIADELLGMLDVPPTGPKDPIPSPGQNGQPGTGDYNGPDYTDQTIYPYDDLNYYYIPGNGKNGGDGAGGGGGGGGGAGGIRTLGMIPKIPGEKLIPALEAINFSIKLLGVFNKGITLIGGDDVCNAEVVNGSTEGGPGGAGGEGGEGGGGGHGGGASIGVFAPGCKFVSDVNCVYTIGEGGKGGFGGYGGKGGKGGQGLPGRPVADAGWNYQGARGGDGGDGGDGSRGQHGRNGRRYEAIGIDVTSPFIMSDIATGCTNSVISIFGSGESYIHSQTRSSGDLNLVQDKPSGSSFEFYMDEIRVVAADTGRLPVSLFSYPYPQVPVYIKTIRPLPALNVPTVLCLGDTLNLSSDVNSRVYSWKIYNSIEEVIYTSDKQSISFVPDGIGNYIVGFQVYDRCCGFSAPQYRNFRVSTVKKPIIEKTGNNFLYCQGTDSSRYEVISAVQLDDKLRWTNGGTNKVSYVKDPGWYSVILTTADGCAAQSDSIENYVFPVPKGKPIINDLRSICNGKETMLMPDYEDGVLFNFYYEGTSKTSGLLVDGVRKQFLTVKPFFKTDSISYFIRKVNTNYQKGYAVYCVSEEVEEIKLYRDKYPPVVISDNVKRSLTADDTGCGTYYTYKYPKAVDNCSPYISVTVRRMPADHYYPVGTTTDTLRYTDVSGNILDYPIEITVYDGTPPSVKNKPAAHTEIDNEPGTCGAYYPFTLASATDNCTPMPALTSAISQTITTADNAYADVFLISGSEANGTFRVGNNKIRQTWSDASHNISTFEQTIAVKDVEAPELQCSDITYYVAKDKNTVFTSYNAPSVTDNCSVFLTSAFVSGFGQSGEHPIGTTTEVWNATDASGNVGSCSFNLTVLDIIPPTIDCSNIRPSAAAAAGTDEALVTFATPVALDNSGSATVTTTSPGSGAYYKLGAHQLEYVATDNSGNSASCIITVAVSDYEAPAIACPPDIQVSNDAGLCGAAVSFTLADAPDNDGSTYSPYQVMGLSSGAVFPMGTTQQVFKVADTNGNTATCGFNVTVTDTEAPQFTACPGNITAFITPEVCGKMISLTVPSATDNSCTPPGTGFVSGSAGGFFPVGVTHQVYRATDGYGNTATCEFDVTITDNTTLSITCPPNVEMNTTPGLCGAIPSIQFPQANHLYSCLEWKQISANGIGDLFTPGLHTVTYEATVLGQRAGCSFTVNINDVEGPKISPPDNIVVALDNGTCGKVVTFPEPAVKDNCTNYQFQRMKGLASGAVFPVGTTVQKYIAFDNVYLDSASFTVTVLDNDAPVFTDVPSIAETTSDLCGKVISFSEPVATDNSSCLTITRLSGQNSGDLFPVGITSQVYVAKDAAGNTDTTRFNIEITSTADAQFTNFRPDVVVMSDNDLTQVVWYDTPGRVSCAGVTSLLLSGKGSGATFPAGNTTETYLITDASGKSDTCRINVFVAEKVAPYIKRIDPYYFELDDAICGAWVTFPVPEVDDFGGSGLQTIFNDLGPNGSLVFVPVGYSQIMWTAIDKSGNRGYSYNQVVVGKEEKPTNPFSSYVEVCAGSDVAIDPKMSGDGPYVYEWSYYDPATFQSVVVSTDSIFRIPNVQAGHEMQYMYVVSSPCNHIIYQHEFFLKVKASPVVTLTGLDAGYCEYDVEGQPLSYSPAGGVLVGAGLDDGKFYPPKAGIGSHEISYVYYDPLLNCASTASLVVNVYATPVVGAFIDSAYCINNVTMQLDAVNSTYSGPGINGSTFSAAMAQVGTHTITRTVVINGCVDSLSQSVRIQGDVPDATILTMGPVCSNESFVELRAVAAGGTWSGPHVYADSSRNTSYFNVNAATLGEHKVYHKLVNDLCISEDSVTVAVVNAEYGLPFTFEAYCYDQGPVQLDVSDNKNYFGYGIDNNKFNPAAYDTTATALYGVSTRNANGCIDTVWRAMAVLKPELADPDKLICKAGDSVALSADTTLASVTWFDHTTGYTKTVSNTGSYVVELRNTVGCIKLDTFLVQSKQAILPPLINNTRQLYKCAEAGVNLTVDADYAGYLWSTGAHGDSITVSLPGEYRIYVTDDKDCELYDSIVVRNYPRMADNQVTDNGTYLEAIASPSYVWYKNGIPIDGADGKTLTVMGAGNYYVSIIDTNGCLSASDTVQVVLTAIDGESEHTECFVYPNPGKGRFVFQFTSKPEAGLEIVVINALGQPVTQFTATGKSEDFTYPVNLEAQPPGVYWALLNQKSRTTIVKLVKVD